MFKSCFQSTTKLATAALMVGAAVLVLHPLTVAAQSRFERIPPDVLRAIDARRLPTPGRHPVEPRPDRRGGDRGPTLGQDTSKLYAKTTLQVRQLGKDFETWGSSKTIVGPSELKLRFRWKTGQTGAASAKYEVSRYPFPAGPTYEPPYNLDAAGNVYPAPQPGKVALFDINFTPILQDVFGSIQPPPQPAEFFVRLIPRDGQGALVGPPSNTVRVEYQAPNSPTQFDSMKIRFTSIKCLDETDGEWGDSDEVYAVFLVANLATVPPDTTRFVQGPFDDMDAGETKTTSRLVHEHAGPGYDPEKLVILVALMEEDTSFVGWNGLDALDAKLASQQKSKLPPDFMRDYLVSGMNACLDDVESESDHDRIGGVRQLNVPLSDWNQLMSGQDVAPRKLTFSGDGGKYVLTFQISN